MLVICHTFDRNRAVLCCAVLCCGGGEPRRLLPVGRHCKANIAAEIWTGRICEREGAWLVGGSPDFEHNQAPHSKGSFALFASLGRFENLTSADRVGDNEHQMKR